MADTTTTPTLGCRDSCGARVADQDAALAEGWSWLEIAKQWRCPACWRALQAAGPMRGTDGQTTDNLPPDSIGALKKLKR
jgi:hypothetical protein